MVQPEPSWGIASICVLSLVVVAAGATESTRVSGTRQSWAQREPSAEGVSYRRGLQAKVTTTTTAHAGGRYKQILSGPGCTANEQIQSLHECHFAAAAVGLAVRNPVIFTPTYGMPTWTSSWGSGPPPADCLHSGRVDQPSMYFMPGNGRQTADCTVRKICLCRLLEGETTTTATTTTFTLDTWVAGQYLYELRDTTCENWVTGGIPECKHASRMLGLDKLVYRRRRRGTSLSGVERRRVNGNDPAHELNDFNVTDAGVRSPGENNLIPPFCVFFSLTNWCTQNEQGKSLQAYPDAWTCHNKEVRYNTRYFPWSGCSKRNKCICRVTSTTNTTATTVTSTTSTSTTSTTTTSTSTTTTNTRSTSTTTGCMPKSTSTADAGWPDNYRGWYDVQGCGRCYDYCRWVGGLGPSGGDPAAAHVKWNQFSQLQAYWSCRLAGGGAPYTSMGYFLLQQGRSFTFRKCTGEGHATPTGPTTTLSGYITSVRGKTTLTTTAHPGGKYKFVQSGKCGQNENPASSQECIFALMSLGINPGQQLAAGQIGFLMGSRADWSSNIGGDPPAECVWTKQWKGSAMNANRNVYYMPGYAVGSVNCAIDAVCVCRAAMDWTTTTVSTTTFTLDTWTVGQYLYEVRDTDCANWVTGGTAECEHASRTLGLQMSTSIQDAPARPFGADKMHPPFCSWSPTNRLCTQHGHSHSGCLGGDLWYNRRHFPWSGCSQSNKCICRVTSTTNTTATTATSTTSTSTTSTGSTSTSTSTTISVDLGSCMPKSTSTGDAGYADSYRGWYDVQGCGRCYDYCRWVGNYGSGGNPAVRQLAHVIGFGGATSGGATSYWSCRLAGGSATYTASGRWGSLSTSNWNFPKCMGEGHTNPGHSTTTNANAGGHSTTTNAGGHTTTTNAGGSSYTTATRSKTTSTTTGCPSSACVHLGPCKIDPQAPDCVTDVSIGNLAQPCVMTLIEPVFAYGYSEHFTQNVYGNHYVNGNTYGWLVATKAIKEFPDHSREKPGWRICSGEQSFTTTKTTTTPYTPTATSSMATTGAPSATTTVSTATSSTANTGAPGATTTVSTATSTATSSTANTGASGATTTGSTTTGSTATTGTSGATTTMSAATSSTASTGASGATTTMSAATSSTASTGASGATTTVSTATGSAGMSDATTTTVTSTSSTVVISTATTLGKTTTTSTQAPKAVTTFAAKVEVEDAKQFDADEYVKRMAEASGVDAENVEIVSQHFHVEVGYQFTGDAPITEDQARQAIADAHSVAESQVAVTIGSSRRLQVRDVAARMLSTATSVTAVISTPDPTKANALHTAATNTTKIAESLKKAGAVVKAEVKAAPAVKVKIHTKITSVTATAVKAPDTAAMTTIAKAAGGTKAEVDQSTIKTELKSTPQSKASTTTTTVVTTSTERMAIMTTATSTTTMLTSIASTTTATIAAAEVIGSIILDVANAARFARDVKAQNAMKNAVASMADVSLDLVTVWLSVGRRLYTYVQSSPTGKVLVNYRIRQTSASKAATLVNSMKALKIGEATSYVIDALKNAQVQDVEVKVVGITAAVGVSTTSSTTTSIWKPGPGFARDEPPSAARRGVTPNNVLGLYMWLPLLLVFLQSSLEVRI